MVGETISELIQKGFMEDSMDGDAMPGEEADGYFITPQGRKIIEERLRQLEQKDRKTAPRFTHRRDAILFIDATIERLIDLREFLENES